VIFLDYCAIGRLWKDESPTVCWANPQIRWWSHEKWMWMGCGVSIVDATTWLFMEHDCYPLVIYSWWFSIVMLAYQRVTNGSRATLYFQTKHRSPRDSLAACSASFWATCKHMTMQYYVTRILHLLSGWGVLCMCIYIYIYMTFI
jgi:hypothetical protein